MSQVVLIEHGTGRKVTDPREFDEVIFRYGSMRDATGLRRVLELGLLDPARHDNIPDIRFEAIKSSLMWIGNQGSDEQLVKDWMRATVANRPVVAAKMMAEAIGESKAMPSAARAFHYWLEAGADLYRRVPQNDSHPAAGYGSRATLAFRDCAPIVDLFQSAQLSTIEDYLYGGEMPGDSNRMLEKVATFQAPGGARRECNLFEYMGHAHGSDARFRGALTLLDTDAPEVRLALADTVASFFVAHRLGRSGVKHRPDTISKVASLIAAGADLQRLRENLEALSREGRIDAGYGLYPLLAKVDHKLDIPVSTGNSLDVGLHYAHVEQAVARLAGVDDFADEGRSDIDINAHDKDGQTALHLATRYGSLQLFETLVVGGADVNARTSKGELVDDCIKTGRKTLASELLPMVTAARARQAIAGVLHHAGATQTKVSMP
jgi:hypothetical protein